MAEWHARPSAGPRTPPGSPTRKGVVTIGGKEFALKKHTPRDSGGGVKNKRVVFADALGRRLASERAFARDEPLRGDFEPPPRAPPVWDYLSPETRRLITEAAAASREAFAEADAKRAAAGEGDAAEDAGYAAEDG